MSRWETAERRQVDVVELRKLIESLSVGAPKPRSSGASWGNSKPPFVPKGTAALLVDASETVAEHICGKRPTADDSWSDLLAASSSLPTMAAKLSIWLDDPPAEMPETFNLWRTSLLSELETNTPPLWTLGGVLDVDSRLQLLVGGFAACVVGGLLVVPASSDPIKEAAAQAAASADVEVAAPLTTTSTTTPTTEAPATTIASSSTTTSSEPRPTTSASTISASTATSSTTTPSTTATTRRTTTTRALTTRQTTRRTTSTTADPSSTTTTAPSSSTTTTEASSTITTALSTTTTRTGTASSTGGSGNEGGELAPPSTFTVSSETASSLTVTWSTTTGTGYHLINQKKIERIALPGETSFTYRDDIGPGRNYLLAVHTMAADGSTGPPTVLLHRTAGNDGTNVNAAANPTLAFDSTASEIAVNWPNVAGNAGYTIFVDGQPRSDSPLAANQNSFAMTGLQPNTYYLVEVQTLMNSDDGNSERIAVLAKTAAS